MFYIKKISKDKIENILLNYRTQNYYLENLNDKNNYLLQLSKDILALIKDKNENDIKLLKNLFIYLFDEKYKNNKELFLDNVIDDFVEENRLLFKKNEENELFEKVKKEYSKNTKSIKEKINKKNRELISYKNIIKIFEEEKLYIKDNKEKIKLFTFFIYLLKKCSSYFNTNNSITDFIVEDVVNFFDGKLKFKNDKKIKNSNDSNKLEEISITSEEVKKILDNFILKLKTFLNEKKLDLKKLIGENNIKKNEKEINFINIFQFFDLLKQNEFELDKMTISCILSNYKIDENSENININLLEKDINK